MVAVWNLSWRVAGTTPIITKTRPVATTTTRVTLCFLQWARSLSHWSSWYTSTRESHVWWLSDIISWLLWIITIRYCASSVSLYIHDRNAIARGWRTCGTRKHFLGKQHLLQPQFILFVFFSLSLSTSASVLRRAHITDCLGIVRDLLLLPKNTGNETFLHRSGALQSVGYIYHWSASLAVTGPIHDIGQNVLQFSFQKEVAAPLTSTISSLSHSSRRSL